MGLSMPAEVDFNGLPIQVNDLEARIHANETKVDYALISADGKSIDFYGPDEPKDPREGDLWFKGDGVHAKQMLIYHNGKWELLIDANDIDHVKKEVDAHTKEIPEIEKNIKDELARIDGELNPLQDSSKSLTDKLNAIDLSDYAKQSDLQTKADEVLSIMNKKTDYDALNKIIQNSGFLQTPDGFISQVKTVTDPISKSNQENVQKIASLTESINGLQTSVDDNTKGLANKLDISAGVTQDQLRDTKSNIESDITQTANQLNERLVSKGQIVAQINQETGKTLIQNKNIYLDASTVTFSGNAFIPSAAITSIDADKLTVHSTIDGNKLKIINVDADSITSGHIKSELIDTHGMNITDGSLTTKSDNPSQSYVYNSEYAFDGDAWTIDSSTKKSCYFSDYEPTVDGSRKFGVRTYWGGSDWRKIPNGWHRVAYSSPEYFDTSKRAFSGSIDITIANDSQNKWSDSWTDVCATIAFYKTVDDAIAQKDRVGWKTLGADVHKYTSIQHIVGENVWAPDGAEVVCMEYWVNGSGSSGFNGWCFFQRPIIVQGDHINCYVPNAVGGEQNVEISNGYIHLPYKGGWLDYNSNQNRQMNGQLFITVKGMYFQGSGNDIYPGMYTTRYGADNLIFSNSNQYWMLGKHGLYYGNDGWGLDTESQSDTYFTSSGLRSGNIYIGRSQDIGTVDGQEIHFKTGSTGYEDVRASSFNKASTETIKKDIQPANLTDATNDILNLDLTTFRYKGDDVTDRKNIGAVIGNKYNLNHNLITTDGQGVILDNVVGSLVGTVQRQAQQISDLNSKVTYLLLKGGYNNE